MITQSKLTTDELEAMKEYVHEVQKLHGEQSKLTTDEPAAMKEYVHEVLEEVDKFKMILEKNTQFWYQ